MTRMVTIHVVPHTLLIRTDAGWPEASARLDVASEPFPAHTGPTLVMQWNALPPNAHVSPQATIAVAVHYDPDRIGRRPVAGNAGDWTKWFTRLTNLRGLKDRWNSYTAPRPDELAIRNAEAFLTAMRDADYEPTRLAPSAMGGVAITRRQDKRKVLVEFYNDGRVYALFSDRDTLAMDVQPVPQQTFAAFIPTIRKYLDG